ncbi:DUF5959 family protein [Streptomyces sp. NBC_00988]|uniref:DUF5959 family protein n=1 Tax=Streptomyces sp. NBC_00988 TaxID=2903704 RepID=UPI0038644F27|nr:DUF5959 family protein [Streptomyces sp. NBC_00988]
MFPYDLVRLSDLENEVVITVLSPMDSPFWEARIMVTSTFVKGATLLVLSPAKLDSWAKALEELRRGRDVVWMKTDRGPTISIQLDGERDCPEVVVEDESLSMVTIRIPIALEEGWIADQQARLGRFNEQV